MTEERKPTRQPPRRATYQEVLGAHLRALRRQRDVKASVIAERFEVSEALLSKVERGARGPSPATLAMYCEVLGVPLLDLLADVAMRHRELLDPFDPLLRLELPPYVRALDGLALYAGIPARHMPRSVPARIPDTTTMIFGASDVRAPQHSPARPPAHGQHAGG
ncbi:transcriptional regulator with XRE-family HTH domain [Saccharothrix ecbatanensis]|uniref:Transcriptional regulator with XRE-family HTH domain n=1 Tax=Saccharothrix ecbatanensis TaxID=1105145 RepID=A0A7W9M5I2_9PSEU|nr:helix-turn-helix domain-containing protein [Saccharothrix ecbatanensis]MBB5808211.1 transcriptional regulator with XRE-family HTH domain [Saccharothrix ecbatanensis]